MRNLVELGKKLYVAAFVAHQALDFRAAGVRLKPRALGIIKAAPRRRVAPDVALEVVAGDVRPRRH